MLAESLGYSFAEFLFQDVDLTDPADMAHFLCKLRAKERMDAFLRSFRPDYACAQDEHVHVVVFHSLMSRIGVVAKSRPDAANLVGGDAGPHPAATDENATFAFICKNAAPDLLREIGIVHGRRGVRANIDDLMALLFQALDDRLFQIVPCMVTTNDDEHE